MGLQNHDPKDPQKLRIYAMERIELRGLWKHVAQVKHLERMAKRQCKLFDVPRVAVLVRRFPGESGGYDADCDRINLDPECGRNYLTLAHELAHHIVWYRHSWRVQDHGPTFMRIYAQLLHSMKVLPIEGTRALCRRYGVRIG